MGDVIADIRNQYEDRQEALERLLHVLSIAEQFEPATIFREVGKALCADIFLFLAEAYDICPQAMDHALTGLLKTARRVEIAQQYRLSNTPPPVDDDDFLETFEKGWDELEEIIESNGKEEDLATSEKTTDNTYQPRIAKEPEDIYLGERAAFDIAEAAMEDLGGEVYKSPLYDLDFDELEWAAAAEEHEEKRSEFKEKETIPLPEDYQTLLFCFKASYGDRNSSAQIDEHKTLYDGRIPEDRINEDMQRYKGEEPTEWQMIVLDPARLPPWMADAQQAIDRYLTVMCCTEFTEEVIRLMHDTRNMKEKLPMFVHAAADIALMMGEIDCVTTLVESQRPLEADQEIYKHALIGAWHIARYKADFPGMIRHYLGFMSSLRDEAEQQMKAMKKREVTYLDV